MPESVTDRPTKAHEQVFLLAKKPRYYYDADAVREGLTKATLEREQYGRPRDQENAIGKLNRWGGDTRSGSRQSSESGANLRSVWSIASTPLGLSHFAAMPIELAARCIKASTSERGVCGRCGAPRRRVVEREERITAGRRELRDSGRVHISGGQRSGTVPGSNTRGYPAYADRHLGWQPTCPCGADSPVVPATVFDPFCGAATTLLAARQLGRHGIGVELNRDYIDISLARLRQHTSGRPDGPRVRPLDGQGSLFDLVEGA